MSQLLLDAEFAIDAGPRVHLGSRDSGINQLPQILVKKILIFLNAFFWKMFFFQHFSSSEEKGSVKDDLKSSDDEEDFQMRKEKIMNESLSHIMKSFKDRTSANNSGIGRGKRKQARKDLG